MGKEHSPKVTILVPIYNTERYLEQCLQSLKDQTLQDIEILCLNDGSTDGSPGIIEKFCNNDERFRLISKPNTGYGNTMNLGIREARGEYIGILEGDDFTQPDMYDALYEIAQKQEAEVVKSDYFAYEGGMDRYTSMDGDFPYGKVFTPLEHPQIFGIHPSIWSAIYKREFLIENNIVFLETPGASFQDIGFSFRVFATCRRLFLLNKAFISYRMDNDMSSINSSSKLYCVFDEMDGIYDYIENNCSENQERLKEIADWVAFREYDWNFHRIGMGHQMGFLEKAAKRLEHLDPDKVDRKLWPENERFGIQVYQNGNDRQGYFDDTNRVVLENEKTLRLPVMNNDELKILGMLRAICTYENIRIYGAGKIGRRVFNCIRNEAMENKITSFVVTHSEEKDQRMFGIPVIALNELSEDSIKDDLFIVAVELNAQMGLVSNLVYLGAKHIICLDKTLRGYISNFSAEEEGQYEIH